MNNNSLTYAKEKILKINGEYVKFYVTTNNKLHQLLANSGAAVIYHESSTGLNYLYVGGQLIASGYGVSSTKIRNSLEKWAEMFDDGIIEQMQKDIEANSEFITNNVKDVYEKFSENFVEKDGGDITDTVFTPEGIDQRIIVKDILGLLEDIHYEKFKFGEPVYSITYCYPNSTTNKITDYFLQSSRKILPVGARVTNVQVLAAIELNDCGSSNWLRIKYYPHSGSDKLAVSDQMMSSPVDSKNYAKNMTRFLAEGKVSDVMNQLVDGNSSINLININNRDYANFVTYDEDKDEHITDECLAFNLFYDVEESKTMYMMISEGDNPVINDVDVELNGTPQSKYKPYSFTVDNPDYDEPIHSTTNLLETQIVNFKSELGISSVKNLLTIEGAHMIYAVGTSGKTVRIWKRGLFTDPESEGYVEDYAVRYPGMVVPASKAVVDSLLQKNEDGEITGFMISDLFNNTQIVGTESNRITGIWNYTASNSFELSVNKGQETVAFTLPYMYDVEYAYYTDENGAEIDMTGYLVYCGCQEHKDDNNSVIAMLTNQTYRMTSHTKLFYMYSLDGYKKDFTIVVRLRKLDSSELAKVKFGKMRIDVNDASQIMHGVEYDTDHWYDADASVLGNVESVKENAGVHNDKEVSLNILKDYLENVSKYM